jgi:hypothetical protein
MALPMGIPGAFGLPVSPSRLSDRRSSLRLEVLDTRIGKIRGETIGNREKVQ